MLDPLIDLDLEEAPLNKGFGIGVLLAYVNLDSLLGSFVIF